MTTSLHRSTPGNPMEALPDPRRALLAAVIGLEWGGREADLALVKASLQSQIVRAEEAAA